MSDDIFRWHAEAKVIKFEPATVLDMIRHVGREPVGHEIEDLVQRGVFLPDDIHHEDGNLLTSAGLNRLTALFEGAGGAVFNAAQAIIGVGSSTTAAAVGDTALGGNGSASTAYYQGVDTGYPTQANGVINANATFGTGNGNFTGGWQEWCLAIATGTITPGPTLASVGTSPVMFNHKVANLGVKASGAIWTLQATCTIS
ncbi:hypothetical protein [Nocardia nova]